MRNPCIPSRIYPPKVDDREIFKNEEYPLAVTPPIVPVTEGFVITTNSSMLTL